MSSQVDVARALKDKDYFNSLTPEQQAKVRREGGVGDANITDKDLDSASGGVGGGGGQPLYTGTDAPVINNTAGKTSGASMQIVCHC